MGFPVYQPICYMSRLQGSSINVTLTFRLEITPEQLFSDYNLMQETDTDSVTGGGYNLNA